MVSQRKHTAIVSLGSNINPRKHVSEAIRLLSQSFVILRKSKFVQTKPIGFTDQADFLNGSVLIRTSSEWPELMHRLKEIERQLKRIRTADKNGPRTIDLDVIVWDNNVVDDDVYKRPFLRDAVRELLPEVFMDKAHNASAARGVDS